MTPSLVTITGADDSVEPERLIELSLRYPFVEWGILVSKKHEGSPRFPSRDWVVKFSNLAAKNRTNVSMHICGRWVRDLLMGVLDWKELPAVSYVCQRIQINTHAEPHISMVAFIDNLKVKHCEFIFQFDGVNDHLFHAARGMGVRAAVLFDKSGGAGILPDVWPEPLAAEKAIWCGYAGGLGPDNLRNELAKINRASGNSPCWVDMERRVRVDDDSALDLDKVQQVLSIVEDIKEG